MFKLPLFKYIKKYPVPFTLQAVSGIIYNVLIAYAIVLLGKVVNSALVGEFSKILISVSIYIGVLLFYMIFRFLKRYYVRDFAVLMEMDIRKDIFDSVINKSSEKLDRDKVGDLMSRTGEDVTKVAETIRKTVTEIWDTWLLMLSYFVSMLIMNPKIALISSIFIPVSIVIAQLIRRPLYKYSKQYSRLSGKISTSLQQTLVGTPVLRLSGAEEQKKKELDDLCKQQSSANLKITVLQSAMRPVYVAVASLGIILIIIMGGKEVIAGTWLIGTFWSFLTTFTAMASRTPTAAKVLNMWHSGEAAWERIKEQQGNTGNTTLLNPPPAESASIEVSGLSFKYPLGTKDAVKNVSFSARPDEIIGITGPIGGGKTALCLALTGIYEYSGSILVNGKELRNLSEQERTAVVSYTGHEQFLFSASVKDNIAMNFNGANLDIDDKKLSSAVYFACLEDDIKAMENGPDTLIGERGVQVSGGQKQRIALARAIYQDHPLLLLDDPFSALDILTERKILQRLKELSKKTIIIFSHRLGAFKEATRVLILREGQIIEDGTHKELIEKDGIYKQIYLAQNL